MEQKNVYLLIIGLFIAVLSFIAGRYSRENEKIIETQIHRDTVTVVDYPEPIVLEKVKSKIEYIKDTIIQTQPFEACIDTIVRQDTVNARYNFPENIFSLEIRKKPDSTRIQTITILKESIKTENQPWWHTPLAAAGGVLLGIAISNVSK